MSRIVSALLLGALVSALVWPGPPAAATTATFTATADTYVHEGSPDTNYGDAPVIGAGDTPVRQAFLKFTLSGITGRVTGVRLHLHTSTGEAGSTDAGMVQLAGNTSWDETAMTWRTRPAIDGRALGRLGAVDADRWYETDVTHAINANGTYTVAITSTNDDSAYFDTRLTRFPPRLVVTTDVRPSVPPTHAGDPVLVGAGDIAACDSPGDEATAALLDSISGTVFTAGDNAYHVGSASEFAACYEPSWGRHRARTRPAVGNHDYRTNGGAAYFAYFGDAAGEPAKGYYSYDLGAWQVIALNSNCEFVACGAGSAQERWLRAELAASPKRCTVAYLHEPLWTSGLNHKSEPLVSPLYQALHDHGAEIVIAGHNHQYERFAPQNPWGELDPDRGIRQFVAGMGGASHYGFGDIRPHSQARNGDTYGVLKLTLRTSSYDWEFVPEPGKTFTDSGTDSCH